MLRRCIFDCVIDYNFHGLLILIVETAEKLTVRNQDLAEDSFSDGRFWACEEGDGDDFSEAEEVPDDPKSQHEIQTPLVMRRWLLQ